MTAAAGTHNNKDRINTVSVAKITGVTTITWSGSARGGGVEQTRGQCQTGRNDLPGKGERLLSGW